MARASLQRLICGDGLGDAVGRRSLSALGYMAHGGHGCISVTSNVAPPALRRLLRGAACAGDWSGALAWQDRLIRLHKALFLDASPAPTKFALAHLGLCARRGSPADRAVRRGGQAADPGGHGPRGISYGAEPRI